MTNYGVHTALAKLFITITFVLCYSDARDVNVTNPFLTAIFTRGKFCLRAYLKNNQAGERPLFPYCLRLELD